MEEARQYSAVIEFIIIVAVAVSFVILGLHHFIRARRALRDGNVEPLVIGFTRAAYSRMHDPAAFWTNVILGFLAAALGAFAFVWLILWVWMLVAAYFGQPTL